MKTYCKMLRSIQYFNIKILLALRSSFTELYKLTAFRGPFCIVDYFKINSYSSSFQYFGFNNNNYIDLKIKRRILGSFNYA